MKGLCFALSILVFIVAQAYAADPVYLDFTAVREIDVTQAPCARSKPFSDAEVLSQISPIGQDEELVDAEINGVHFSHEKPALIELFKKLTTADRAEFQHRAFALKCAKVLCAVQKIFGPQVGPRMLFMLAEFGFNSSPMAFPRDVADRPTQMLKLRELDDVLLSLSDLPKGMMLKHGSNQVLIRAKAAGVADATIELFNGWSEYNSPTRRHVLMHELGHVFGENGVHSSPEWRDIEATGYVSYYAKTAFYEDFAETFAAYRYRPALLLEMSKEKYAFMRDRVFSGIEYTQPEQ